jgi:heme-degrading monooxygenase HmoA
MHARTGWLKIPPERFDEAVAALEKVPGNFRDQKGYKGFVGLIDREGSQGLGISFWDSLEDLEASDQLGAQARQSVSGGDSDPGGRLVWEVVVDDEV